MPSIIVCALNHFHILLVNQIVKRFDKIGMAISKNNMPEILSTFFGIIINVENQSSGFRVNPLLTKKAVLL